MACNNPFQIDYHNLGLSRPVSTSVPTYDPGTGTWGWSSPSGGGGGTVTSVDGSGGTTGLTLAGGPITTAGTLTIGGTLAVASGGTGATTQGGARTNLGLGTLATQSGTFSGTHSGTSSGTNTGDQTITLTGDVTGSGTGSFAATIGANKVTNAAIRQSAGLSVVGRAANTTGDVADVTGTAGQVLRVSGTTLGFGAVDLALPAAVTGILTSANGGTGNGFTKFSGPAAAEKTFTLPDATATILTDNAAVTVAQGGTGTNTLTAHAVVLGNGAAAPSFATIGTAGRVLVDQGAGADPAFAAVSGDATLDGAGVLRLTSSGRAALAAQAAAAGGYLF